MYAFLFLYVSVGFSRCMGSLFYMHGLVFLLLSYAANPQSDEGDETVEH